VRIGLVTDVHSHAEELARALEIFRKRGVDRVVTIGDTIDAYTRSGGSAEVAELLTAAGAIGVWGNHDFGLRGEVEPDMRARFTAPVFDLLNRMQPRLVVEDCHFSHKEASVDPFDIEQLWELSEHPLPLVDRAMLGFAAVPQRRQFVGHYHRWWAAEQDGQVVWQGEDVLNFSQDRRYFVVVGATCEGWCGILDLNADLLEPIWCGS
jgi:hypothetical protein